MRERKPSPGRRSPQRRKSPRESPPSKLELVRKGVRRFILDEATFADFRKAIRLAASEGKQSPRALPGWAFRKIVKEAVAERKLFVKRRRRH